MSKILIKDSKDGKKAPFLRGILTRSLQAAGLSFEEAYDLASNVRDELATTEEITTRGLRSIVARHLEQEFGTTITQRYQRTNHAPATILVERTGVQTLPFSRGELRQSLESCGLSTEQAMAIVARIYDHLVRKGVTRISSRKLGYMIYRYLRRELGPEAAQRYLVWVDYRHGTRPLIILIGGTAGCGKSTLATELASKFDIVRTQSTDMLREVMRMMLPNRLLPILHTSSFDAWKTLPAHALAEATDPETRLADGYRTQVALISVASEAVIQRAIKERVSLILEGVHTHPSLLNNIPRDNDATIVPIMLSVADPDNLRRRFKGRGKQAPNRRAERYLKGFDAIWQLQSFLKAEAEQARIPVITNDDRQEAVNQVMKIILDALAKNFTATPKEVFI
jgi:2-phosphoglycerate kinase